MATVPTYSAGPQVQPTGLAAPPTDRLMYRTLGAGGQQMEDLGRAVMQTGAEQTHEAVQTLDLANQVRVDAALNDVRQKSLDLTYDPQNGYAAQKGAAALNRDSGQPLPQEYTGKLQGAVDDIAGSLSNDAQRRAFLLQSNNLVTSFNAGVQSHTLQEFKSFALSTADGTLKLAADAAKQNWNDPDAIGLQVDSAKGAIYKAGQVNGWAASETQARMQTAVSAIHAGVIDAALQNNNPIYAMQYLGAKKGEMSADDILKVNGQVNRDVDARVSTQAVTAAVSELTPRLAPTNTDRLNALVLGQESGGKDFNANGTPVTSAKGALYAQQVVSSTAGNPGYGIKPANTTGTPAQVAAEYDRVGQQYLQAMVKNYGNVNQALAAYNAGPGAVDAAIKAGGANWLAQLPKETQDYVAKISSQYDAGAGVPPLPTKAEFIASAVARLGDNPRPEQLKLTQQAAEHQYGVITSSRTEQGQQVLVQAQQALIANGGDFTNLDPKIKTALAQTDPGAYDNAMKFAKAIAKGPNETDPEIYATLATYPDEMAKLSDAQFMQFKTKLSDADFKHFANERADILNGKTDMSAGGLNAKALTTSLNERLENLKIDPAPKKTDAEGLARVGAIQKFVRDDIFAQQQQLGRKMSAEEISSRIDTLFAKNLTFRNTFFGVTTGTSNTAMLGMKWGDVPGDTRDAIDARMPNATDGDKLRAYWNWKKK